MTRSTLTRLADGVVMATPSPSVRIIWHHNAGTEHIVAYLGFDDAAHAETCYQWIAAKFGRYDRKANSGVCKVRKARRVDGLSLEIKWHCPDPGALHTAIERDLARSAVAA